MPNDNVNGNVKAVLDEISALKREVYGFAVSDYRTGFISALSVLEGFIAGLPAAGESKWISVEEQLPEYGRYLVITRKGNAGPKVHTATYNHMGWWTHSNFGDITHWMPLPQPPGEEVRE